MPLQLDDFNFIQDAFKEGLKGVLFEFVKAKNGNVILAGCNITGSSAPYNVSEGFVMMDYEVYHCPAQTSNFSLVVLEPDITYDPSGNDLFQDGVARDTYEVRRAKPVVSGSPSVSVTILDENRLIYTMPEALKGSLGYTDFVGERYNFQASDFLNGATASASYPPYAIKKNGCVRLYGAIDASGVGIGTNILTLPIGFRKGISTSGGFADIYLCSYGTSIVRVGVSPTGLKYFDTVVSGNTGGSGISLNQISYDIQT